MTEPREKPERVLSDQLCACGCGKRTYLALKTARAYGWIKGEPLRYRHGHGGPPPPRRTKPPPPEPNPSGLCFCGCGRPTPLAKATRHGDRSTVAGKPLRYVHEHRSRRHSTGDYVVDPSTGCWLWQRQLGEGYGRVNRDGYAGVAHRWMYEQRHGPIARGHHLHHKCENPMCVNPDHLEPLTPAEHARLHAATST